LVLKSSDGGETFISDGNLGAGAVFCVFITPAFIIYASGSQGMIWRKQEPYPYPAILVTPDSLQFDTINAGASQVKTLTVTNTGSQDLVISDISSTLPEYSANPTSFTVTPGQSKTVDVTFAPMTEGIYTSTLSIYSNAPGQNITEIILNGYATFPVGLTGTKAVNDFFNCYPNPFSESFNVDINLTTEQTVYFQLLDGTGNLLYNSCKNFPAGIQHFESPKIWPASTNLPKGIYFMKIFSDKIAEVRKIVKLSH
jgi:hypothetical protein